MEHLRYRFAGDRVLPGGVPQLVGVVASGNLEVLIEPVQLEGACAIDVSTPVRGFAEVWAAVVADFFRRHRFADVRVSINDSGATPAIVALRLDQAAEEYVASARKGSVA
jgi:malonate decarboxylase delta subunit